ncbi:MAG TPA: histidine kinase [Candidatus Ornithomonoglobus intestinigallinarum]|uniref:histidine kinase n=1 Tax=Candidatus Ornithomonoglobus intestinigallinarum TaxID=2840894 RepID=A0A9D1H498_9FIRM|nr:histidine kinase [Candidatus Ornithomonoglobus intestinigallinarum]
MNSDKNKSKKNTNGRNDNWFYIKNFRINSLFWRTFLLVSMLLVIPFLIVGIIFYSNIMSTTKDEIIIENSSKLESIKSVVDNVLNECDMMSSYIASNDSAQPFMLGSERGTQFMQLVSFTKTVPLIYEYIDSVYMYSEHSNTAFVGGSEQPMNEIRDDGWLDSYESLDDRRGMIMTRIKNDTYPPLITIIKPIYVSDEKMGAVIMNINSQQLYRATVSNRYSNGQEFFMLDGDDKLMMTRDISYFEKSSEREKLLSASVGAQLLPETLDINGEECLILSCDSDQFDFRYISTYPVSLFEDKFDSVRWQIALVAVILLAFCFILAYIATVWSYSPLREIISFLDTANPPESVSTKDQNELLYIMDSIKLHIEDKEKMEEILEERMKLLKKAQYDMLQAQINPHFLYNTLETINWMAYELSNSDNPVSEALINLASFFRNTLSQQGYLISISDEIKYTKDYLNILKLRYGDLFDIKWNIDNAVLSYTIIKICLQPIIENAVYHGFKPKGGKGLLVISGVLRDDNIIFTVRDDGAGMDPETLDEMNSRLSQNIHDNKGSHIGLANVNERIKIIFGSDYGLKVESSLGIGTCVYVTIPATKADSAE